VNSAFFFQTIQTALPGTSRQPAASALQPLVNERIPSVRTKPPFRFDPVAFKPTRLPSIVGVQPAGDLILTLYRLRSNLPIDYLMYLFQLLKISPKAKSETGMIDA
jgi:hypothetical protein